MLPSDARVLTVGEYLRYLSPEVWETDRTPVWPPDAFALVASLLHVSGAYVRAGACGPGAGGIKQWVERVRRLGKNWRKQSLTRDAMPEGLHEWWQAVLAGELTPLREIRGNTGLCEALLGVCAAADEASRGVGLPYQERSAELRAVEAEDGEPSLDYDAFAQQANFQLERWRAVAKFGSTLCRRVHPSKVRVLPKFHTPQTGLTIRSLSHHLALCPAGEVKPIYQSIPTKEKLHSLNLLLLPWPEVTTPAQFEPVPAGRESLPGSFRYFRYRPAALPAGFPDRVAGIIRRASQMVGRIDGVICPELSMTTDDLSFLRDTVLDQDAFLLCGVCAEPEGGETAAKNCLRMFFPWRFPIRLEQDKHHRWLVNKSQIVQYGLGGTLDPTFSWWEHIPMGERTLNFVALRPLLSICTLICEDLARPDPVADMIRAVGPNLVIALLMDGPQLVSRWPARYATVLADDPGSSVLTLTAAGMVRLSRPPEKPEVSRVVALWKDAQRGPYEIQLPPDADAVVLSIAVEAHEEWTADGRSDGRMSGYPIFSGVHPVPKVPEPASGPAASKKSPPRGKRRRRKP